MDTSRARAKTRRRSPRAHSRAPDREPRKVAPHETHRGDVDAAKLETPRPRRAAIERLTLLERLRADQSPVVVVSAPGGYGKSILGSQWSHQDPRPNAWVQLDEDDDDPIRLTWYLLHAVGSLVPVPDELYARLAQPAPRLKAAVLPGLAELLRRGRPSLLVLDDVHLLGSDGSLEVLAFLVDAIPDGWRLMLLTRSAPTISLSSTRLQGRLLEIGADQLALSTTETQQVARAAGWTLDHSAALDLRRRTEGWPAAVSLAAHAMRHSSDGNVQIASITGAHDIIAEYLAEVALSRLDADRLRFLLSTSVLDWMSGPLCDTALGTEGSADILDGLARDNLFVVPLDARRDRYRYHHLFREWLRTELGRRDPDAATTVLGRAAAWHEQRGDDAEAFDYARQVGDFERAGRVALGAWDRHANTGRLQTMRLWLDRCTKAEIESDPQLALAAAWVGQLSGEPALVRRYFAAVERGDLDKPSADGANSLRAALANARSAGGAGGVTAMLRDGEFVIASERSPQTRWLLGGYRAVGIANVLLGRSLAARTALEQALALSEAPAQVYVRAYSFGWLALACADLGDWDAAARSALQGRRLVDAHGFDHVLFAISTYVAMAVCKLHAGAARRAAEELTEVARLFPMAVAFPWLAADVAIRCGEAHLGVGDRAQALAYLDSARESLARYPDAGTLPQRLERLERKLDEVGELSLTSAEQRLLPFLPTHLSLREIADRTGHSRATIKTQVASIYAKLGVEGRSEAVERLESLGLLSIHIPAP
jgi:LuxR family maltose regulon positive regulatory protein